MLLQQYRPLLWVTLPVLAVIVGCSSGDSNQPKTPSKEIHQETDSAKADSTKIPPKSESLFEVSEGFQILDLSDFEIFHGKEPGQQPTWTTQGDVIRCGGQPRGYLRSKKTYRNFTLRLEYRFPEFGDSEDESKFTGNSGFLIYITGEDKLWPKCLEVQGKFPEMATIKSNSRDVKIEVDDNAAARKQARKPPGEWNSIEIISKEGALTSKLNGQVICTSQPSELTEGAIGIQSEDFAVEFRNIRIQNE